MDIGRQETAGRIFSKYSLSFCILGLDKQGQMQ